MVTVNSDFLTRLMLRHKLNWRWKLEPEQRLCVEIADELRKWSLDGRLGCVWGHTANEGKRHKIVAMLLKAMGLIGGAADYTFLWSTGCGVIEIKVPAEYEKSAKTGKMVVARAAGRQSGNQKDYEQWCKLHGVPYEVCYTVDGVEDTLRKWGVLR